MKHRIVVRPQAVDELAEAHRWYGGSGSDLGDAFEREFLWVVDQLLRHPKMYQIIEDPVRRALTRRFPYAIFYMVEDEEIVILRVQHCRQKPIEW